MSRSTADWITLAEAVEILGAANIHLRPETLGRWAREGRLQTLKIGGPALRAASRGAGAPAPASARGRRGAPAGPLRGALRVVEPGSSGAVARRPVLEERPGLVERTATRVVVVVEPLVARILGVPRIGMAHAVYMRFSASSGPVLARGLAFVALFALVPALLVVLSVAGVFVSDPAVREEIVAIVAEQFPPLGAGHRRGAPELLGPRGDDRDRRPRAPRVDRELPRARRSTARSGWCSRTRARAARRSATWSPSSPWRAGRSRPRWSWY